MPRTITELRVFISCPSDLSSEKSVIVGAISALNAEFAPRGIALKALTWETDIVPGVGPDPQSVINPQLDYDIYIGMLGTYFGSPTPRAGSGTEEEFESALATFNREPKAIRLLFYFRTSTSDVFGLDLAQLQKVKDFQRAASKRGLLYSTFTSEDDLLSLAKSHIRSLVTKQWDGIAWTELAASAPAIEAVVLGVEAQESPAPSPMMHAMQDDDTDGIWDLVVEIADASSLMKSSLDRMLASSASFANDLTRARGVLEESLEPRQINGQAYSMNAYAEALTSHGAIFFSSASSCLVSFEKVRVLVEAGEAGDPKEFNEALNSFAELVDVISTYKSSIQLFRSTLRIRQRFTKEFNAARHRILNALGSFSAEAALFTARATVFIADCRQSLSEGSRRPPARVAFCSSK